METDGVMVPIIDIANFPEEKEKLIAAVMGPGFFRVINHGIPHSLMSEMKTIVKTIFELPTEVKRRNKDTIALSGYIEPNRVNPIYESLGIYQAGLPTDVDTFCSIMGISSDNSKTLSVFASQVHGLTLEMATRIAEGLGVIDCSFQEWSSQLRLIKFNFTNGSMGTSGVYSHTDPSFLTLLLEDHCNEGLEIMNSSGKYVPVHPVPGTFFFNIGDFGKVWSNGRLHNVEHRVICKKEELRISVVLFLLAPKDNMIIPHVNLIDSQHPQLYQSLDQIEYRKLRITRLSMQHDFLSNWATNVGPDNNSLV